MIKKLKIYLSQTKKSYDILFDIPLRDVAKQISKDYPSAKIFIITDNNVKNLYGEYFLKQLQKNSLNAKMLSVKAGEKSKTRDTKEKLEDLLIRYGANRDSLVIAFGGGVIGDLAGFTAATLLRGVRYLQIPTTLIAQVDSSVGGKVGIDHPLGKNLIGAFYHPEFVFIDTSVLKTLSKVDYLNGLAEIIKYAAILDEKLFIEIEKQKKSLLQFNLNYLKKIIFRCCELKANVITKDEKEKSYRRILNFGHTVGHAIELLSDYKIPHGFAIAIGMAVEADFSVKLGLMKKSEELRLTNLLKSFGFETKLPTSVKLNDFLRAIRTDKKALEDYINFTLLRKIGKAEINVQLTEQDIQTLLMFYDLR